MPTLHERIDLRLDTSDECWRWLGAHSQPSGRPVVGINGMGGIDYVYRIQYRRYVGEIPDGMTIDHLCMNGWCCRPDHLQLATHSDNAKAWNAARTHCDKGHEMTPENSYRRPDRPNAAGPGLCRECRKARDAA